MQRASFCSNENLDNKLHEVNLPRFAYVSSQYFPDFHQELLLTFRPFHTVARSTE